MNHFFYMATKGARPRFSLLALLTLQAFSCFAADRSQPLWTRHATSLPESIWSVEAIDANHDGRLDVIAMGETKVFAMTNPQLPDGKAEVLVDTKDPKMLYCVALDADQDGDMDLAVGRYRVPWIEFRQAQAAGKNLSEPKGPEFSLAWFENPVRTGAPWALHVIDREFNGTHGLWVGDVDGDGVRDLLADSIMGPHFAKSLAWFRAPKRGRRSEDSTNPGVRAEASAKAGGIEFSRHLIAHGGADGRPHYLDFADMNGDRRGDLLVGDPDGATFTWWEQPSHEAANRSWTRHEIGKERGATNIRAVDVNGDGSIDVVGSCGHGKGVFWFEGPEWKKRAIDAELRDAHALAVADFDRDGDPDVATASFGAKIVRWYENDGKGMFAPHDIDVGNRQEAYDLKAVDLDGDGRVDLIMAGRETRNAVWYRNGAP